MSVFEVPYASEVEETVKGRLRNMENGIEKGREDLSRRPKSRKSRGRSGKLKQSDTAKHGEKNKSLRLRGTSPSIIVN